MVRLFQRVICPLLFGSRCTLRRKLWNPSFEVTPGFFISWDLKVLSIHWDFGVMSCHGISGRIHQLGRASCKSEPAECQEYFKTRLDEAFLLHRAPPATRQNKDSQNLQCLADSWSQIEDRFSLYHEQIITWPITKTESLGGFTPGNKAGIFWLKKRWLWFDFLCWNPTNCRGLLHYLGIIACDPANHQY